MNHIPSATVGGNHPQGLTNEQKYALLTEVAGRLAENTKVEWQETAWIKDSPGHVDGSSLDVAPRLWVIGHEQNYAGAKGSDPALFQRPYLWWKLAGMAMGRDPSLRAHRLIALLAVENDHIHIQLLEPHDKHDWGRLIPVSFGRVMNERYADSAQRATQTVKPR